MDKTTSETQREIFEIEVFGGYEAAENFDGSEPSRRARALLRREYRAVSAIPEIRLVDARKGRALLHGWNSAPFAWRCGQFGSFATLPAAIVTAIEAAIGEINGETD